MLNQLSLELGEFFACIEEHGFLKRYEERGTRGHIRAVLELHPVFSDIEALKEELQEKLDYLQHGCQHGTIAMRKMYALLVAVCEVYQATTTVSCLRAGGNMTKAMDNLFDFSNK